MSEATTNNPVSSGNQLPRQPADPGDCRIWSAEIRRGIVLYDLKSLEVLLLLILCDETFERNYTVGLVDFDRWQRMLNLESWRKLRPVWESAVGLLIVDFNAAQGTYQLRPFMKDWSRVRGLRAPKNLCAEPELALVAERPLSDALSSLSREKVLGSSDESGDIQGGSEKVALGTRSFPMAAEAARFRAALDQGTTETEFPEYAKAASTHPLRPAAKSQAKIVTTDEIAEAWLELQKIDSRNRLKDPTFKLQWEKPCADDPRDIIKRLVPRVLREMRRQKEPVGDGLAYAYRIYSAERRINPPVGV